MKKHWKKILTAGIAACFLMSGAAVPALAAEEEDLTRFVGGTYINGVDVSGLSTDEARGRMEEYFKGSYQLKIQDESGNKEIIKDTDIGYTLQVSGDLTAVLNRENEGGRVSGPGVDNSYRVDVSVSFDEGLLRTALENLWCVKNASPTTDAHVSAYEEGKPFTIIPEVQGNEVDMEKLVSVVKTALSEQKFLVRLKDYDCYKEIQVRSDDAALNELCATMNAYRDVQITYQFGQAQEVLSVQEVATWITGSTATSLDVDEGKAAAYVAALAAKYDTYGDHPYKTTSGRDVVVFGKYGWKINQAEETRALVELIRAGKRETREPIYASRGATHDGYDFGQTYIEVDLAEQHLYFYKDGQILVDGPIVTGNVSRGHTTPPGLFELKYKARDQVLRGPGYASPVKYWMPFNGGIGLHDASWRGKFGGTIYRNNGSHGCINLPTAVAAVVYEHAYKGLPILCCN